jgi:hypothetical protein
MTRLSCLCAQAHLRHRRLHRIPQPRQPDATVAIQCSNDSRPLEAADPNSIDPMYADFTQTAGEQC